MSKVSYLPQPHQQMPNPFRRGARKAQCFELFRAGGDRQTMVAEMERLGVARSTARTWLNLFGLYARGYREGKKGAA